MVKAGGQASGPRATYVTALRHAYVDSRNEARSRRPLQAVAFILEFAMGAPQGKFLISHDLVLLEY